MTSIQFSTGENRAMAYCPSYFDHAVKNNTGSWNLDEFRSARAEVRARNGSDQEILAAYPVISATEEVDPSLALTLVVEPGDMVCFSANHLHGTIPNTSHLARFSTEIRTVQLCDLEAKRAPSNLDSK